ncbi:hypothetical protein [Neobacillus drentensis]|uniref:hypothetical protein n=1 Tax=Neobacillus drentensis TaxID=220684 RepID=UPI002FFDD0F7
MRTFINRVTSRILGPVLLTNISDYPKTTRLVIGALLGSIAVIFQSAGIFTGVGYILSMMTTGPIVLATLLSARIGGLTFLVTIILLAIVQPSELLVFPFTTGLLGLSLGIGLTYFKRTLLIVAFSSVSLTLGICLLLYGLKFPILGPSVSSHFSIFVILSIFAFSFLYSWIWLKLSIHAFKMIHKVVFRRYSYDK